LINKTGLLHYFVPRTFCLCSSAKYRSFLRLWLLNGIYLSLFKFLKHASLSDLHHACYVKLNAMVETMNEQHIHFASEMAEYGLLYETDTSLSSSTFEVSLYYDYESSLPLKADSNVNAPLTDPE